MLKRNWQKLGLAFVALAVPYSATAAEPAAMAAVETQFNDQAKPLVVRYCLDCHSTDVKEGELDLERFAALADVRRDPKTWQKVDEMLAGQMPPKDSPQPTDEERAQLQAWIARYLDAEAEAQAGDPGPVVLRRLSNAEYTYTIQDLTGVPLTPAKEFPVDGAAGEGFTNTGQALVMSPALLTKYFDAAKGIAGHVVLLPEGFRFSQYDTRRDWTDEIVGQIKMIYARHSNAEGRLPLDRYFAATLAHRDALTSGAETIEAVAASEGLNPRYLATLWKSLTAADGSPVIDAVRARWRQTQPADAAALVAEVATWQNALARFQNVGHRAPWVVAVDPLVGEQEVRFKIADPAAGQKDVTVYLAAGEAGDGAAGDIVEWRNPRLVMAGRPDIPLRDLRGFLARFESRRQKFVDATARCLEIAAGVDATSGAPDAIKLAEQHQVDADSLGAWLDYLGLGTPTELRLDHFTQTQTNIGGYDFVRGWGPPETPNLAANPTDREIRIPGNLRAHGVVMHPGPALNVAAGWQSPIAGTVTIGGSVQHAHPECGNGVVWSLELRRGPARQVLASGISHGGAPVALGPIAGVAVRSGDLVSLLIGPRDGNHSCDLTDVELTIATAAEPIRSWSLRGDVSGDVLAGNPHADGQGNAGVWHFYTEPVAGGSAPAIPAGSILARWQTSDKTDEKQALAAELQALLRNGPPGDAAHPDAVLYRQLTALGGPLFARALAAKSDEGASQSDWALDPAIFGRAVDGSPIEPTSLSVAAPGVVEIRLPADLLAGGELVATAVLRSPADTGGSVQVQALAAKPEALSALRADAPILIVPGSASAAKLAAAFGEFRALFPPALCYMQVVPVDEVITLTLFHREDEALARLMLDDNERVTLDRLWRELRYVSQDAFATIDALAQILEYATQDADPGKFTPMKAEINAQAAALRQAMVDAEPSQLAVVLAIAEKAYRRPLSERESLELRDLYKTLRAEELPHDEALRLTLARVLVSPAFLYKIEQAAPGAAPGAVSDCELATRLSYFLWSSQPDDELRDAAASGRLHDPDVLAAQSKRMLKDARVRRLATEFACQWLHIYGFDTLDEKSESHFPTFAAVRGEMYEEAIQFFTDMFQRDGSWSEIYECDHAFLNESLAAHYGIPGVTGPQWRRVDGVSQYDRGGVLGLGAILATQSGASRTSPILRGTWVSEVILGEKLPKPPKDVPQLPDDEGTEGLTVRQMVERHTSDARCTVCHERIDPLGFSLEGFDAIGRRRERDAGDRAIDTAATLKDGTQFSGRTGLRDYLLAQKREVVLQQFCKKLLGYSLGREVQLSDRPVLAEMREALAAHDGRISAAVEVIVRSPQFRMIRGRDAEFVETQ